MITLTGDNIKRLSLYLRSVKEQRIIFITNLKQVRHVCAKWNFKKKISAKKYDLKISEMKKLSIPLGQTVGFQRSSSTNWRRWMSVCFLFACLFFLSKDFTRKFLSCNLNDMGKKRSNMNTPLMHIIKLINWRMLHIFMFEMFKNQTGKLWLRVKCGKY